MDKRGGEYQDFPSKIICLTVPKNFAGEPFRVSVISGIEKVWIRGGGGGEYQDFLSKIICLTVPKIFVGEPFSVSLISGIEKVWIRGGGGEEGEKGGSITILCQNFFVSHCRKFS